MECPHEYFGDLRNQILFIVWMGRTFLVSCLDLIKEVVGDPQRFSSRTGEFLFRGDAGGVGFRPPIGEAGHDEEAFGILATADPPDHTRHRGLLSRILSTGSMKAREGSSEACRWRFGPGVGVRPGRVDGEIANRCRC